MSKKHYPVGYCIDMPDGDPGNIQAYRDFHNQVARLYADDELGPTAKAVMTAYFLYGSFATDSKIMQHIGISRSHLYEIKSELMRHDWLASPEE